MRVRGILCTVVALITVGCGETKHYRSELTPSAATTAADGIPRISRVPMTTPTRPSDPDAVFSNSVASLPIAYEDARLLAISSCMAFRQNPGTSYSSAVDQLARQQAWTVEQTRRFLNATTEAYCPEFRAGS